MDTGNAIRRGMALYRASHPSSRRATSTAIVHNGSSKTVFECICGSTHSTATRHRGMTLHEAIWKATHAECALEWLPLGLA